MWKPGTQITLKKKYRDGSSLKWRSFGAVVAQQPPGHVPAARTVDLIHIRRGREHEVWPALYWRRLRPGDKDHV